MNNRPLILLTALALATFVCQLCLSGDEPHEPTQIPFDIDHLTDEQKAVIDSGISSDSSSYSVLSRPILFQIVGTGNDADETRHTQRIDREVDVLIYALGEARDRRLVDYGWIESVETGRRVWEMDAGSSTHAGGDPRNRKDATRMKLGPGRYVLRYRSDDSHAYGDWRGDPPERPTFYGVTVFNMTALPMIEAGLQEAGVAPLRSTLRSSGDGDAAEESTQLHARVLYLEGIDTREAVTLLRSRIQVRRIATFGERELVVVAGTRSRVEDSESLFLERGGLFESVAPHPPLTLETDDDSEHESQVFRLVEDGTSEALLLLRSIYQIRRLSEFPHDRAVSVQAPASVLKAAEAMLAELGLLAAPNEEVRSPSSPD